MRMQIIEANELRCSIYQIINSEPGIISSAVASAIEPMLGTADIPEVTMTSPTAPGVTPSLDELERLCGRSCCRSYRCGFPLPVLDRCGSGHGQTDWRPHGQDDHAAAGANFNPVNSLSCGLAAVGRMMRNDARWNAIRSIETLRVHHAPRRRGNRVAARGARAVERGVWPIGVTP